jgi:hypothetical protein
MKDIHEYEKDISSIRNLMERSVKVISLSGLSGVMAGLYALAGATAAYFLTHYPISPFGYRIYSVSEQGVLLKLLVIAALVLVASIVTGLWMSFKKAKRFNVKIWDTASKKLLINLSIPLITGGLFILVLLYTGHFGVAAPASLIFYGLALIHASANTYDEVRYLGFTEIAIGLISAILPGFGLIFWAIGFGVMHIVYGSVMYFRYDK